MENLSFSELINSVLKYPEFAVSLSVQYFSIQLMRRLGCCINGCAEEDVTALSDRTVQSVVAHHVRVSYRSSAGHTGCFQ